MGGLRIVGEVGMEVVRGGGGGVVGVEEPLPERERKKEDIEDASEEATGREKGERGWGFEQGGVVVGS